MRAKPARSSASLGGRCGSPWPASSAAGVQLLVDHVLEVAVEVGPVDPGRLVLGGDLRGGDLAADLLGRQRRQQRLDHRHQLLLGHHRLGQRQRVRPLVRPADHRLPLVEVAERAEGDDPRQAEHRRVVRQVQCHECAHRPIMVRERERRCRSPQLPPVRRAGRHRSAGAASLGRRGGGQPGRAASRAARTRASAVAGGTPEPDRLGRVARRRPVQPVAASSRPGRDEGAVPPPGLQQPGRLQLPVRPGHRVRRQAQVGGELPDRRAAGVPTGSRPSPISSASCPRTCSYGGTDESGSTEISMCSPLRHPAPPGVPGSVSSSTSSSMPAGAGPSARSTTRPCRLVAAERRAEEHQLVEQVEVEQQPDRAGHHRVRRVPLGADHVVPPDGVEQRDADRDQQHHRPQPATGSSAAGAPRPAARWRAPR